jgi:hypothetical protein
MAVVVVVCTWRDRAVVCRGVDEIVGRQAGRQGSQTAWRVETSVRV